MWIDRAVDCTRLFGLIEREIVMTTCKYRNVSERDMDLLFMEAFATDPEFSKLFLGKTAFHGTSYTVLYAERSKIDSNLGESDLTVIFDVAGKRHALLIEDKIDAVAMKNQCDRYHKRGEKAVKKGDYDSFDVFIVCPEKYRNSNDEAAKYEHFVSYEECRDYFASCPDVHNKLRFQQISEAIETMKPEYKLTVNEIAVESFRQYAAYQKEHYPSLRLQNKPESNTVNGWWPHFIVPAKGMYILHKTDRDAIDLTVSGAKERMEELRPIQQWLHDNVDRRIELVETGKSASFRVKVAKIQMGAPFDTWSMDDLNDCFDTIQELHGIAVIFGKINSAVFP